MTLSERVEAVADLAPLSQLSDLQREELDREVAGADALEDLPGKWQAAVLEAEGAEPTSGCCHGTS